MSTEVVEAAWVGDAVVDGWCVVDVYGWWALGGRWMVDGW